MYYEREEHVQSPLEKRFLEDCVTVGLRVEPQFKVGRIHADFGMPDHNLVIECDSQEWHSTQESSDKDHKRDLKYAKAGYSVIRIRGDAIMRGGELIAEKIKWVTQQGPIVPGHLITMYVYLAGDDGHLEVSMHGELIEEM